MFIVEDSLEYRERLIEFVTQDGLCRIVGCSDTEDDAVTRILQLEPDTVILDVQLRAGHGLNVLRKLKTLLLDKMPAVIMLTDFAITDFGRHAALYGARHFLDKTSGMKQLQTILRLLAYHPRAPGI